MLKIEATPVNVAVCTYHGQNVTEAEIKRRQYLATKRDGAMVATEREE